MGNQFFLNIKTKYYGRQKEKEGKKEEGEKG